MNDSIKHKQRFKGKIISLSQNKTAIVEVTRLLKHPKYKKYFKRFKRYSAHYETGQHKIGEMAVIESARPISKTKKWVLI
ncbi:MAG: 30S ribosomal protein S17 [Candidatus Niyogibacteria bacterium]|nr:MAG: 30S ribosomal protein S17 [Candidatus Niyogibacteria bacterium]